VPYRPSPLNPLPPPHLRNHRIPHPHPSHLQPRQTSSSAPSATSSTGPSLCSARRPAPPASCRRNRSSYRTCAAPPPSISPTTPSPPLHLLQPYFALLALNVFHPFPPSSPPTTHPSFLLLQVPARLRTQGAFDAAPSSPPRQQSPPPTGAGLVGLLCKMADAGSDDGGHNAPFTFARSRTRNISNRRGCGGHRQRRWAKSRGARRAHAAAGGAALRARFVPVDGGGQSRQLCRCRDSRPPLS
jgi:hypothetical protein